jgi:transglutaminase-like putative cysteine protease
MTPATAEHQAVWSSRVTIQPAAWSFNYTDYWGTAVTAFELHEPHERLTVHAQGVVETHGDDLAWDLDRRVAPNDLGWPALRDRAVVDKMTEFLTVNDRTQPSEELAGLAATTAGQPPRLAALDVCSLIHDHLTYERGSTKVSSTAREAWELGRGVCQDYSHVALGALRSIGLPARYVSGYLHPGSGEANKTVEGESHSWIEWWCGSWVAYDPTHLPAAHRRLCPSGSRPRLWRCGAIAWHILWRPLRDVRHCEADRTRLTAPTWLSETHVHVRSPRDTRVATDAP